ncbi:MAG: riboflavin synthase [Elusimicrobiota bacterium]
MFTGIVRGRGKVVRNEGRTLRVSAAFGRLRRGSSVSVNGVCLTVTRQRGQTYAFDVSPETLRLTNLGGLRPGDPVNLEPSLKASDSIGGHWVSGHVDARGSLLERETLKDGFVRVRISLPQGLRRMVAYKGSISVDGTSLTVTRVGPSWFETVLIPETLEKTTLGVYGEGSVVNLEVDLIARYLDRLLKARGL